MSKTTTRTILGAATLALAFQAHAGTLPRTGGGRPKPRPVPCTFRNDSRCAPLPPVPAPQTPPVPRSGK